MSETFTISAVGDPREWSSQKHGGRFLSYPLDLEDEQGKTHLGVEWSRKFDSDAPKVGDRVAGHIENGTHGDKLKIDWDAMKGGGGGSRSGSSGTSSGGSNRTWKPEAQFDPERTARITRSHSQHMAVRVLTAMGSFEGKSAEQLHGTLKSWVQWFEDDVNEAGQKAIQGAGTTGTLGGAQANPGPGPESPSADERDLYQLLEAAGLNAVAARVVTDAVNDAFSAEQRDNAIHRLSNENLRSDAVAKLTAFAEKHTGEPLPAEVPYDDDIPF